MSERQSEPVRDSDEFGGVFLGRPMCVVTNDHYWRGGSVCTACGARLRCGCGRFIREDDLDRHDRSGECSIVIDGASDE